MDVRASLSAFWEAGLCATPPAHGGARARRATTLLCAAHAGDPPLAITFPVAAMPWCDVARRWARAQEWLGADGAPLCLGISARAAPHVQAFVVLCAAGVWVPPPPHARGPWGPPALRAWYATLHAAEDGDVGVNMPVAPPRTVMGAWVAAATRGGGSGVAAPLPSSTVVQEVNALLRGVAPAVPCVETMNKPAGGCPGVSAAHSPCGVLADVAAAAQALSFPALFVACTAVAAARHKRVGQPST